ncbi:MAG TPA: sigma-70 family RNA polymerase sigma factor [Patescibacteria group bacterium]|nr:sigma-70 family RNA polymerase sigma factor [Patescibacteria group bacterium]
MKSQETQNTVLPSEQPTALPENVRFGESNIDSFREVRKRQLLQLLSCGSQGIVIYGAPEEILSVTVILGLTEEQLEKYSHKWFPAICMERLPGTKNEQFTITSIKKNPDGSFNRKSPNYEKLERVVDFILDAPYSAQRENKIYRKNELHFTTISQEPEIMQIAHQSPLNIPVQRDTIESGEVNPRILQYEDELKKFIHHILLRLNDHQAEEDVWQTVLINTSLVAQVDVSKNIKAWVYRIAKNACVDELRRHGRRIARTTLFAEFPALSIKGEENGPAEETVIDPKPTPEELVLQKERSGKILEGLTYVLAKQNPKYFVILTLFHNNGLSHREISRKLNITESQSKTTLHRAEAKVREYFHVDT